MHLISPQKVTHSKSTNIAINCSTRHWVAAKSCSLKSSFGHRPNIITLLRSVVTVHRLKAAF